MEAVEFETPIRDGVITIPPQFYRPGFPEFARVIILSETRSHPLRTESDASVLERRREAFRRLDGCLADSDVALDKIKSERLARQ